MHAFTLQLRESNINLNITSKTALRKLSAEKSNSKEPWLSLKEKSVSTDNLAPGK